MSPDDMAGRILAHAFNDELEKLSAMVPLSRKGRQMGAAKRILRGDTKWTHEAQAGRNPHGRPVTTMRTTTTTPGKPTEVDGPWTSHAPAVNSRALPAHLKKWVRSNR